MGSVDAQPSGLSCIKEMTLPVYGGALWLANVKGAAKVQISLDSAGNASDVNVTAPYPSMAEWLKHWFRAATFVPECGDKPVVLNLIYKLEGPAQTSPDNHVIVKGPNTFEVTAHPSLPVLHVN